MEQEESSTNNNKDEKTEERLKNAANKKYNQRLSKNLRNTFIASLFIVTGTLIVLGTPTKSEDVVQGTLSNYYPF